MRADVCRAVRSKHLELACHAQAAWLGPKVRQDRTVLVRRLERVRAVVTGSPWLLPGRGGSGHAEQESQRNAHECKISGHRMPVRHLQASQSPIQWRQSGLQWIVLGCGPESLQLATDK
eukprot:scaffold763_cov402-Prasinococcus_capsulatus_cf.AAC.11